MHPLMSFFLIETIEEAEKFGLRRPYCDEVLTVHCGVNQRPETTMYVQGRSLGAALREWFIDRFPSISKGS